VMFYKERWEDDHFYLPARVLTKWLKMKEWPDPVIISDKSRKSSVCNVS
jgi:hypothetical protein